MSIFVFLLPCLFIWGFVLELLYSKKGRMFISLAVVLVITLAVTGFVGVLTADYIKGAEVKETTAMISEPDHSRDMIVDFSDDEGNEYWGIEPFSGVIACNGPVRITYLPDTKYLLKVEQYITPGEIDLMLSSTGQTIGYKEVYHHGYFFGLACIVVLIIDLYMMFSLKRWKKNPKHPKHK